MMHSVILKFTEREALNSVNRLWKRTLGLSFAIAYGLMAVSMIWLIRSGDRSWLLGVVASVIVLAGIFITSSYLYHRRDAIRKFQQLDNGEILFSFDNASFTLETQGSKSESNWSQIQKVWKYQDAWFLFFARAHSLPSL